MFLSLIWMNIVMIFFLTKFCRSKFCNKIEGHLCCNKIIKKLQSLYWESIFLKKILFPFYSSSCGAWIQPYLIPRKNKLTYLAADIGRKNIPLNNAITHLFPYTWKIPIFVLFAQVWQNRTTLAQSINRRCWRKRRSKIRRRPEIRGIRRCRRWCTDWHFFMRGAVRFFLKK